jgi:hypothetical protein
MRRRRRATIEDLRLAIDCLPRTTRAAMLEGIRGNEIIVGAYSDSGGVCPMLAAHRAGGRTNLIAFARAWDRFAFGGNRVERARPATARELLILKTHLEASLLEEEMPRSELGRAIAEHRELVSERRSLAQSPEPRHRPGDPDRSHELRHRPGWAWTRVVRRYDEYEWALEQIRAAGRAEPEPRATVPG